MILGHAFVMDMIIMSRFVQENALKKGSEPSRIFFVSDFR
jgi:hypothetical protein